jgi:predicted transglutaminase-like cysteine proteinase
MRTTLLALLVAVIILAISSKCSAASNDVVNINNYWNGAVAYADDDVSHGRDYWQTPKETALTRTGDCDDYAIAKYFTLLATGIPESRLKIATVVYDGGIADPSLHTVVLLTDERGTWVLDSIDREIVLLSQRRDIITVMATYTNAGVKWHHSTPKVTNTPAMWKRMLANKAVYMKDAKAAYNTRPIRVTWVR